MKSLHFASIALVFGVSTCSFVSAQDIVVPYQYWNGFQHFNPATAGLMNRIEATASYNNYGSGIKHISGNAGFRFTKPGIGCGVAYNYSGLDKNVHNQTAVVNANYQFKLGETGRLAIGAAVGIKTAYINYYSGPTSILSGYNLEGFGFTSSLGVAYADSNWRAGISATALNKTRIRSDDGSSAFETNTAFWFNAERDLHLGEQFMLTPRFLVGVQTATNDVSLSGGIEATFFNRLHIGANYWDANYYGGNIAYDIKEKLRIGYSYAHNFNLFTQHDNHSVVLSFFLK